MKQYWKFWDLFRVRYCPSLYLPKVTSPVTKFAEHSATFGGNIILYSSQRKKRLQICIIGKLALYYHGVVLFWQQIGGLRFRTKTGHWWSESENCILYVCWSTRPQESIISCRWLCLFVTSLRITSSFLFLDGIEPFLAVSSSCGTLQNIDLRFVI